jgi:hypothetical protein
VDKASMTEKFIERIRQEKEDSADRSLRVIDVRQELKVRD